MKILVFEDDENKWLSIRQCLLEKNVKESGIKRIDNVSQYLEISRLPVDLCIIDILMPGVSGGEPRSAGIELLNMLSYSGSRCPILAITAFPEEAKSLRHEFLSRGCIVYDYQEKETWSQALDVFLAQSREQGRYEFLVFTALKKERDAYLKTSAANIKSVQRMGLDVWEADVREKSGAIILLPRMGLVNAAAIVARALENYSPSIVAMSGICAGLGTNAQMGQLLVADLVWEYQSGKWLDEIFDVEPYQVVIPQQTRIAMSKMLDDAKLLSRLEKQFDGTVRPSHVSTPKLAPFTSGSAVIASQKRLDSVMTQHRKAAGLDMELYGFHRAVELSTKTVHAFSAKVVVDKATETKGDELHEYGCLVSAAFTIEVIENLTSH